MFTFINTHTHTEHPTDSKSTVADYPQRMRVKGIWARGPYSRNIAFPTDLPLLLNFGRD